MADQIILPLQGLHRDPRNGFWRNFPGIIYFELKSPQHSVPIYLYNPQKKTYLDSFIKCRWINWSTYHKQLVTFNTFTYIRYDFETFVIVSQLCIGSLNIPTRYTQSGKGRQDLKKLLLLGPPNSNNLGNFLQHMQKSESFSDVFWRNCNLKFFPYKTSCDKKARFTKWSGWRSSWSKKSH